MTELLWRPASTVILVNRAVSSPLSVLLLRRAEHLRAFPGYWAFPGGQLDHADGDSRWVGKITPPPDQLRQIMGRQDCQGGLNTADYLKRMEVPSEDANPQHWLPLPDDERMWAYWVAAVREVFEELGISLAGWGPTDARLDFRAIHYLGRIAPPPHVPIRFDTRFFAAAIDPNVPIVLSSEADDARWVELDDALRAYLISKPTRYALVWLSEWRQIQTLFTARGGESYC